MNASDRLPHRPPYRLMLGSATSIVRKTRVMRGRDAASYTVRSMVVALAMGVAALLWAPRMWHDPLRAFSVAATVLATARLLVWVSRWASLPQMGRPVHIPPTGTPRVAVVTTFVAGHEPLDMLERTLRAMVALRQTHDAWVLDEGDGDDVRALCARLGVRHFTRRHHARYQSSGGTFRARSKHGNLNAWLMEHGYAEYDVVVAFDVDHVPEAEYLERVLGYFEDPAVAVVQPPQVYYNQDAGLVARGAAEETYAYHSSHLMASFALGHTVVIGSHGAHRVAALRDIGGFPAHDAEDLYLTMLYRAAGWHGVFVPEALALGTTPSTWRDYLIQQRRWARSLIDLKLRVYPRITSHLPVLERALNLLHGAAYLRPLLVPLEYALLVALLLGNRVPGFLHPRVLAAGLVFTVLLAAVDHFRKRWYIVPERERGLAWRASLLQYGKWPTIALALGDALVGRSVEYALTRKTTTLVAREGAPLALAHAAVAVAIGAAWLIGTMRHGPLAWQLSSIALAIVALSTTLAWMQRRPDAPSFTPLLHDDAVRALRRRSHEPALRVASVALRTHAAEPRRLRTSMRAIDQRR